MNINFEITLTDDEIEPYVAREIKPVNDGDVWRQSLLTGHSTSMYSAIAKLCFMKLEMVEKTEEIFTLFEYYARLYPQAAQKAVDAYRSSTKSNNNASESDNN